MVDNSTSLGMDPMKHKLEGWTPISDRGTVTNITAGAGLGFVTSTTAAYIKTSWLMPREASKWATFKSNARVLVPAATLLCAAYPLVESIMGNISESETFNAAAAGCACGAVMGMQSGTAVGAVTGCALLGGSMALVEGSKYAAPRQSTWAPVAASASGAQQRALQGDGAAIAEHMQFMRENARR